MICFFPYLSPCFLMSIYQFSSHNHCFLHSVYFITPLSTEEKKNRLYTAKVCIWFELDFWDWFRYRTRTKHKSHSLAFIWITKNISFLFSWTWVQPRSLNYCSTIPGNVVVRVMRNVSWASHGDRLVSNIFPCFCFSSYLRVVVLTSFIDGLISGRWRRNKPFSSMLLFISVLSKQLEQDRTEIGTRLWATAVADMTVLCLWASWKTLETWGCRSYWMLIA